MVAGRTSHIRSYLLFLCDFGLLAGCYVLAASIYEGEVDPYWLSLRENAWAMVTMVVVSLQGALLFEGLYARPRPASKFELLLAASQAAGVSLLVAAVLAYSLPEWRLPTPLMVLGSVLNVVALFLWRLIFAGLFWSAPGLHRILFVGASPAVREMTAYIAAHPNLRLSVAGILDDPASAEAQPHAGKIVGSPGSLATMYARLRPDRVVIGMSDPRGRLPVRDLLDLRAAGVTIEESGALYESMLGRVCTAELRPMDLIHRRDFGPRPGGVAVQSIYTNLITLLAVVLMAPLLLLIAVAVKLSSRGPVLEAQDCVGFEGVPFIKFQFRTRTLRSTGPGVEFQYQPTALGRWLCRHRLHALPELLNVLRGEMALVGPRPHRVEFAQVLSHRYPYYSQRHIVKPGLTGWAGINLRGKGETADELTLLEYDLYYIKHLSPVLDLYILLHAWA